MRGVKGSRKPEWATCHPGRRNRARGLCGQCHRLEMAFRPATCHPEKRRTAHGLCANCYHKELKKLNPDFAADQRRNSAKWYREKGRERMRAPRAKARMKAWSLRKKYGFTPDEYLAFRESRGNACEICGDTRGPLVIDHDHETGKVRGLLCHPCNLMLGNGRDSADRLRAGVEYLEKRRTLTAA